MGIQSFQKIEGFEGDKVIVHYNVCDHCGQQTQISSDEKDITNGFEFFFYTLDLKESIKGNKYSPKFKCGTFCDRDCLVEFLKANLKPNGRLE